MKVILDPILNKERADYASAIAPGTYENPLTFSTGLTRATNTITANLSVGVAGGQSAIGGNAASENLTLSSTSHATKGKILFGTSAYDEANNALGIGISSSLLGKIHSQSSTGAQFVGSYDASNRMTITTSSVGTVDFSAVGSQNWFRFNNNVGINCLPSTRELDVNGNARIQYALGVGMDILANYSLATASKVNFGGDIVIPSVNDTKITFAEAGAGWRLEDAAAYTIGHRFNLHRFEDVNANEICRFTTYGSAKFVSIGTTLYNYATLHVKGAASVDTARFMNSSEEIALKITETKSVICNSAALATTATDGFLYVPTCAGTPTGTPTSQTGTVPLVWDSTNKKLYIYDGSWLGGTAPGVFS